MLIHHRGLEIPVFPSETPVAWTWQEIRDAAHGDEPQFIRRATFEYWGSNVPRSLKAALALADLVLDEATEITGVDHIQPTWGLYRGTYTYPPTPANRRIHESIPRGLVPKGYSLVAQVDRVENTVELDSSHPLVAGMRERVETYHLDREVSCAYKIRDYTPGQMVFTHREEAGILAPIHVDIEPRIIDYREFTND